MSDFDIEDDYEDFDYDYDVGYKPREDRRDARIKMLEERIQEINASDEADAELRNKSPALQDAWEKYQIVLRTVR